MGRFVGTLFALEVLLPVVDGIDVLGHVVLAAALVVADGARQPLALLVHLPPVALQKGIVMLGFVNVLTDRIAQTYSNGALAT